MLDINAYRSLALLGLPLMRTADLPDQAPELPDVSLRFLKQNLILPVEEANGDLTVVMANPRDAFARRALAMASGKNIVTRVGIASEIENGIEKLLGGGRSAMGQIVDRLGGEDEGDLEDVEHLRDLASEAPVIRLVNLIMQRAVESRASDIHIEPFENRLKVRYRVDGVLQEVEAPPAKSTAAVISRVKIMAKLNIAERRLPHLTNISFGFVEGESLMMGIKDIACSSGSACTSASLEPSYVLKSLGIGDDLAHSSLRLSLGRFKGLLDQAVAAEPGGSGR